MATAKQIQRPDDQTVHHVPPREKAAKTQPKMQPPLTPMIDVTFQLLLYFILTASARTLEGELPGSLPSDLGQSVAAQVPPPTRDIVIAIRLEGGSRESAVYEVSDSNVAFSHAQGVYEELTRRVEQKVASTKETRVALEPRNDVPFQHVADAYNQVLRVKFEKVHFKGKG